jgi:hypothetical protein
MKIGTHSISFEISIMNGFEIFKSSAWKKYPLSKGYRRAIRLSLGLGYIFVEFDLVLNFFKENPFYNEDGSWKKKEAKP